MTSFHTGETAQLLRKALRAPSDTTEVYSDSGRRMEIVREPEPGVELWLLERDAAGAETGFMMVSVKAAATRPSVYPSSLPFVPHTQAVVVVSPESTSVHWHALDELAATEPLQAFKEAGERLKPIMCRLEGQLENATAAERTALAAEARAEVEALDPSVQEKLRALWESTHPDPSVVAEVESVFATVIEASEADGWERGATTEREVPFKLRTVEFRRGEETRLLSMTATTAVGGIVVLMQPPPAGKAAT